MQPKQPASGMAVTCQQIITIDAEDFSNGDKQIVVWGGVTVRPRDVLRIKNRYGVHRLEAGNVNHRMKLGSLVDLIYPKSRPHRVHKKVSVQGRGQDRPRHEESQELAAKHSDR